jgi:F420-non-reducing hydrogenase iron-sulfur subunit
MAHAVAEHASTGSHVAAPAGWRPKILALVCNWCTYAGLDQAGTSRMQRPANVRVLRVMCSGRIEPAMVLDAFRRGADGVIVSGCHIGDCHYTAGNFKMERRMALLKVMLNQLGIHPKRFIQTYISASEGAEATEIFKEFIEGVQELGPSPLNKEFFKE